LQEGEPDGKICERRRCQPREPGAGLRHSRKPRAFEKRKRKGRVVEAGGGKVDIEGRTKNEEELSLQKKTRALAKKGQGKIHDGGGKLHEGEVYYKISLGQGSESPTRYKTEYVLNLGRGA